MLQLPYFSSQTPAYHPYWLKSAFYYSKILDVTICHRFRSLNIVKVFWKGLANVALFDYLVWKQETEKLKETLEKEVLKIEVTSVFSLFLDVCYIVNLTKVRYLNFYRTLSERWEVQSAVSIICWWVRSIKDEKWTGSFYNSKWWDRCLGNRSQTFEIWNSNCICVIRWTVSTQISWIMHLC